MALVLALSLVACSGNSKDELTETQKGDIKSVVYDFVPKCLFAMQNGGRNDDIEFLDSSNHVTEEFREHMRTVMENRYKELYGGIYGSSSVIATVFTARPTIADIEFYDYKCENGQYSVMLRITIACTYREKEFGGFWRQGTPYQEMRICDSLIRWDKNECYLIDLLQYS